MQNYTVKDSNRLVQIECIDNTRIEAKNSERGSVIVRMFTTFYDVLNNVIDKHKDIIRIYFDNIGNIYRTPDSNAVWFNLNESNNGIYAAYNSCRAQD